MTTTTGDDPTPLVLLAHGSPDPRHAAGAEAVADRVRALTGDRPVHLAYLDHHGPSVDDVATALPAGTGGVLAPLLLTAATHVRDDVPEAARTLASTTGAGWAVAAALGPDPLLLDACEELLARGGTTPDPGTAVVLVLGGSSARDAITAAGDAAAERTARGWGPWVAAALSGGEPLEDAVRRLRATAGVRGVVAVTYMVADGILRDRMVEQARALDVDVAPGTLGETGALARLLLRRAAEASVS
ncbi:sirohydrochlorin chelatase [Lapillicoccus jejuensis]|uniref:Sirohydrochlorin ferrochelatase n=1 Tax=Lapillicoccus jejuensis TaxID=402171 RepID=A0A542E4E4_9MICO|nr:CbiX/SirB N-terminal domain-containing protein [Lapillicoccus jejuensis]TQJ10185.1 sirohydrochlorin ferrochelatase [Lapillicoccus jejuensis]